MQRSLVVVTAVTAVALAAGCGNDGGASSAPDPGATRRVALSSPAFPDGGTIPRRFTCDGENVPPPLTLSGLPSATATVALLVQDPDAPHDTFVHWLLWNASPKDTGWPAGRPPQGAVQGRNGFGKPGYGGPCPPRGHGPHRYVFSVYAVDRSLALPSTASPDDLVRALRGHTLAAGTLTGRYGR
jgi:Raf kinase inhibitor-like YbhB/YbcL family protein